MTERETLIAAVDAELRRLLYEVIREVPTGAANVERHSDLQALHRRVIRALGLQEPEFVRSDYWVVR